MPTNNPRYDWVATTEHHLGAEPYVCESVSVLVKQLWHTETCES